MPPQPSLVPKPKKDGSIPRVLLVEDDIVSAAAMAVIFRRRGFEVDHVTTVAEGMAKLAKQPDFVILDLMLPDGDGEAILKNIRANQLPIRVMVTTAICDLDRLRDVRDLKPESLLQKPIDISRLLLAMELQN